MARGTNSFHAACHGDPRADPNQLLTIHRLLPTRRLPSSGAPPWISARRQASIRGQDARPRGAVFRVLSCRFPVRRGHRPSGRRFAQWFRGRHGAEPDREAAEAPADEWMSGVIPETWHSVSPARLHHQCELIGDWIDNEPTRTAIALLPDWVKWLTNRAEYAEPFRTQLPEALTTDMPAGTKTGAGLPSFGSTSASRAGCRDSSG
jgi:hypothetical protein